jgi:hypothetical protein
MFKKLLNNPLDTIGNAVEINKLKLKKSELISSKKDYEQKCKKYDDQIKFKEDIYIVTQINDSTINKLRTIFTLNNINCDVIFSEYENENDIKDEEYIMYKKLYDVLVQSNAIINATNEHINKNIGINKQVYLDKINEIDNKLENIQQKLRIVRDKQFSKNDN